MCGITGIYHLDGKRIDPALLKRMCDAMVHRGPDDEGTYVNGNVGIGMRRLSIIDLSSGHQPIANEDESVWVVLNGEIYNFPELRAELERRGHTFRTHSDTETIVHLYEDHGDACVRHLNGMFCFALWDDRRKRLLIARDRIGEKQLYYSLKNNRLTFGSEIKCVLQSPDVSRDMDLTALDAYLTYLYVPSPDTIFRDVKELPAAHTLVADKDGVHLSRYWELEYEIDRAASPDEFAARFGTQFERAVKSRMLSDVPLGALLSGGIDSSAVVAVMSRHSAAPVHTFCIGYGEEGAHYDERRYAKVVADQYATEHREFVVKPSIVELIPELVRFFDQPFADSSAVANYYVFRETRKHVTVVLSGLGGDEVGAGYERYLGVRLQHYYKMLPRFVREKMVAKVVARLPDSKKGRRLIERVKRFVDAGTLPVDRAYFDYVSAFKAGHKRDLYTPALREAIGARDAKSAYDRYFAHPGIEDDLNRALYVDLMMYLPNDLLTLTDRMSMAHSIEARAPFIDYKLVEFMATVPPEYKLRGLTKKYLLKKAFEGILPNEILHRRKQGFTIPLTVWFRNELNPFLREVLSKERIERLGLFHWSKVEALLDEHVQSRQNHHSRIWSLLMFMIWHDLYMEGGAQSYRGLPSRPVAASVVS